MWDVGWKRLFCKNFWLSVGLEIWPKKEFLFCLLWKPMRFESNGESKGNPQYPVPPHEKEGRNKSTSRTFLPGFLGKITKHPQIPTEVAYNPAGRIVRICTSCPTWSLTWMVKNWSFLHKPMSWGLKGMLLLFPPEMMMDGVFSGCIFIWLPKDESKEFLQRILIWMIDLILTRILLLTWAGI